MVIAALTLAACGSRASNTSPTPVRTLAGSVQIMTPTPTSAGSPTQRVLSGKAEIEIGDQFFLPSQVMVAVGTIVTWTNRGQMGHTATARDRSFGSSTLGFNQSYSFTFAKPGRYQFFCMTHTDMFGEVIVVAN